MAYATPYNYDQKALRSWVIRCLSEYRDDGKTAAEFAEDLDQYIDESHDRFTLAVLNRLKSGSTKSGRSLKTLSEARLEAIAEYRKMPFNKAVEWLSWKDPDEIEKDPGENGGGVSELRDRVSVLEKKVEVLQQQMDRLPWEEWRSRNPFIVELHELLKKQGIDPDSEAGEEKIRAACSSIDRREEVARMLLGLDEPTTDLVAGVGAVMGALLGKGWQTPTIWEMLGAIALDAEALHQLQPQLDKRDHPS